jgi:hypothetical protein
VLTIDFSHPYAHRSADFSDATVVWGQVCVFVGFGWHHEGTG